MAFTALTFFSIFACSPDKESSGSLDGTWYMDEFELIISGKTYLLKVNGENETKGTVTYDDSTFEFIITHEWDWENKKWMAVPITSVYAKIFGNYTRKGEVSAFSEVYRDFGHGPETYDIFNGEWKKK